MSVDLIFRVMCQISAQDNVSNKIQISNCHFQIKKFSSCVSADLIGTKVTAEIIVSTRVLFVTTILTIALQSEISTNSLKYETRTK